MLLHSRVLYQESEEVLIWKYYMVAASVCVLTAELNLQPTILQIVLTAEL